jgi:hypothetical protein
MALLLVLVVLLGVLLMVEMEQMVFLLFLQQ